MDKGKTGRSWWQAHRPTTRRLVQLWAALLHNAYLKGFIDGKIYEGNAKILCAPGLNCYSCPAAAGACPLGSLQNALSAAGHRAGWYVLGILLLYGVILGRTVCGWLCPFGLVQELLHKIPTPKIRKGKVTRALSWLKYGILAVFVIIIPLVYGLSKGMPLPGFCKYICPAGTFEGAVGHLANPANASMYGMLGALFTNKWIILVVVLLACVFCYRGFCRFICPLGAIYSLFSRFALVGVKVDAGRCNGCGACVRTCEMDVKQVGDRECIHCGKCMEVCAKGAISLKAGKITLKGPETGSEPEEKKKQKNRGRILWGIALAVLAAAIAWFNFLDPALKNGETAGSGAGKEYGYEAGSTLADFTLECYDGSEFRLADTRGKVVVINRWATWCTPCIEEIPAFEALYEAHPDDLAMILVHPNETAEDPAEFLKRFNLTMSCATDGEGDPVKGILGGGAALPQTVVLDREGKVIYNSVRAVTPELLEALYSGVEVPEEPEEPEETPEPEAEKPAVTGKQVYTVRFEDPDGNPVPDVMATFCTDLMCDMTVADAEGCCVYENEPYAYHVNVVKVPKGYRYEGEDIYTTEESCSLTVVLAKAEE